MLIIKHLLILLCMLSITSASVVFQNDDQATPFRSTKLTQIAGTMVEMVRVAMESVGSVTRANQSDLVFPEVPFSNQEDRIVLNVLLYDINDGADSIINARSGYFNFVDQLRTNGLSSINTLSNYGNIIYLDLGFWDPRMLQAPPLSDDTSEIKTKKLYGNEVFFYQNFARYLHELMNFQAHNSYSESDELSSGIIYNEYGWLKDALGYFTAYRSTRVGGSAELSFQRVGVGQGIFISGTNRPVFNTCGAVTDFNQGVCDSAVSNVFDLSVQNTVFPVIRLLFHHNSFLTKSNFFLPDLPSLFYRDLGPAGLRFEIGTEREDAQQNAFLSTLEKHISLEDVAAGLGFLTLLYAWEQLEFAQPGKGDDFIQQLLVSDVRSFHVNDILDPKLIDSDLSCDTSPDAVPVDKVCAINQILKNEIAVDNRTFEDYYFDMGAALFMDEASASNSPRSSFQIRNFNFSNLDVIYAGLDPNLTTGTREGMNFVRVVKDVLAGGEDAEGGNVDDGAGGGAEEDNDDGDDVEDQDENANEEEDLNENNEQVEEQNILSQISLNLTTYSLGYVKLENKRAAISDLNFRFDDTGDLLDGVIDQTPITIKSRKLSPDDSVPRLGTTTFKVSRSSANERIATDVIMFQGLQTTNVKFNDSQAAFSKSKVGNAHDKVRSTYNFHQELFSPHFDPYATHSTKAIFDTSGVKGFGEYQTIWEKKALAANDPLAFREYTFSFKTIDYTRTTTLAVVFENRTGILKESIDDVGGGRPFTLNLWVDQIHLSPCDAISVTTDCVESQEQINEPPAVNQPPDQIVNLDPETQTIATQTSLLTETEVNEVITVSGRLDKILTITNPFDVSIVLSFHLLNEGRVSERFTIGSQGNSSILKLAALDPNKYTVMYRESIRMAVQKAIEQIDKSIIIPPKSSQSLLIVNKGDDDEQLIVRLQKQASVSTTVQPTFTTQGGGGGGGCFIATASFGSLEHPFVQDFVWFRDSILMTSKSGQKIVQSYYRYAPSLAECIESSTFLRWLGIIFLMPLWFLVKLFQHWLFGVIGLVIAMFLMVVYKISKAF
ncbi:MAG: CFI-box-CTERM domain-containing protein [bacterium]|nr:CFI-box-CTERM domain-containing protein [bacterium]